MPFKSFAQVRKFGALVNKGKMKESMFKKWLKHTPDISHLPERIKKKTVPMSEKIQRYQKAHDLMQESQDYRSTERYWKGQGGKIDMAARTVRDAYRAAKGKFYDYSGKVLDKSIKEFSDEMKKINRPATRMDNSELKKELLKKKKVSMTKGNFVKEHKHLVKVLKGGSKKARVKEAKEQSNELKKYI
jgi:hypothetical protein